MAAQQLDRALESVSFQDVELAATVITDDDRIDGCYLQIHQGAVWLLACQAPAAGNLRIVAALLDIIRCVDQCVNIAKLVRLSGHEAPKGNDILDMGGVHDPGCALPRAGRGQHRRYRPADGARCDRAVPRVRRRTTARVWAASRAATGLWPTASGFSSLGS